MPVTTLRTLCEQHAPTAIDFLKIDVEGAEREVLRGRRLDALPAQGRGAGGARAGHAWRPSGKRGSRCSQQHGYRFACFDSLNRYYVAEEHAALAERLADGSGVVRGRDRSSATSSRRSTTPRTRITASRGSSAGADMVRLPLMSP